jgi:hypothetical protein
MQTMYPRIYLAHRMTISEAGIANFSLEWLFYTQNPVLYSRAGSTNLSFSSD